MPLDGTAILQENTGGVASSPAATGVTVTLPAGTTAGTTVIAALRQINPAGAVTLPAGWVTDVSAGSGGATLVVRKSGVAAGESSWTFTNGATSTWAWYVCEVDGLDTDPLDASASGVGGSGAGVVSTGTTGANSGTDTLLLACFGATGLTGASPGVWGSYPAGYVEAGQVAIVGTGTANGFSVAVARAYSGGAVTGPFTASATVTGASLTASVGMLAVYRSAASPVVNPLAWQVGFEHGTHNGLGATLTTGGTPIVSPGGGGTVGTDYIVQASSARAAPSVYGCRVTAAAAARFLLPPTAAVPITSKALTVGANLRVVSATGTVVVAEMVPGAGTTLQLVYDATSTRYGLRWGAAGTVAWQTGTTPLGTWVWVDMAESGVSGATWHGAWRLETGPGSYSDQPSPADLTGQAPSTIAILRVCGGNVAQTFTADIDDIVASTFASSFPLGPHTVQALRVDPAATPTVSGTVGNFALVTNNATGATLTAGTLTAARDAIDDLPPVISAASDGFVQTTAAATDYLHFPMDTVAVQPSRVIAGVKVIACLISTTGNGAGNLAIRGFDGTTETALVNLNQVTPGSSTAVGTAIPPWATAQWNPPGGWTQAKLDAAALRIGFSSDATPDMGVHAVYLEVASRPTPVARQISVEGAFTVNLNLSPYSSASVSYDVASTDPTRGATFGYSIAGVAQTPVYVPASSSVTVPVAADLFGDISDVTLTPDPAA